jgi:chromosome segregation ATPase
MHNRIKELESFLAHSNRTLESKEKDLHLKLQILKSVSDEKARLELKVEQLTEEKKGLQWRFNEDLEGIEQKCQTLQNIIEVLNADLERCRASVAALRAQNQDLAAKVERLSEETRRKDEELEKKGTEWLATRASLQGANEEQRATTELELRDLRERLTAAESLTERAAELERRIQTLTAGGVEEANQRERLLQQLQDKESQLQGTQAEAKQAAESLRGCMLREEEERSQVLALQRSNQELREQLNVREAESRGLRQAWEAAEERAALAVGAVSHHRRELGDLKRRMEEFTAEGTTMKATIANKEEECAGLRKQLEAALAPSGNAGRGSEDGVAAMQARPEQLEDSRRGAEAEATQLTGRLQEDRLRAEELQSEVRGLQQTNEELRQQLAKCAAASQELQHRMGVVRQSYQECSADRTRMEATIAAKEAECAAARERLRAGGAASDAAAVDALRRRVRELELINRASQAEHAAVVGRLTAELDQSLVAWNAGQRRSLQETTELQDHIQQLRMAGATGPGGSGPRTSAKRARTARWIAPAAFLRVGAGRLSPVDRGAPV